jgi:hypothetical protein
LGVLLTTCGKGIRIIGVHFIRLVAIGGALTATLLSQQPAPPIACADVLSDKVCDLGLVDRDASRSVPHPRNGSSQYRSFSPFDYWGSYNKHDELVSGCLWASPFSSREEGSSNCCGSELGADRNGDFSVSTANAGTLCSRGLAGVSLWAQNQQSPPVPQSTQSSADQGSPKHIFWFVPAFHVSYLKQFKPLTPREKFHEWLQGTYDPRGLGLYAIESATLEHSSRDGFCGYGKGWGGYGRCLGSMELDANISSFFGDFLFPVIMHQDPRYFRRGEGSFGGRMGYAVSRVFITHADSGRTVFFTSALSGSVLAAAASNLYYPAQDRGFGHSVNRMGIDLADTALFNVAVEFWPDIRHILRHVF